MLDVSTKRRRETAALLLLRMATTKTFDGETPAKSAIVAAYWASTTEKELVCIASDTENWMLTCSPVHKTLPATETKPLSQSKQTVEALFGAYFPASHATQTPPAVPAEALYLPAGHFVQVPPSGPSNPGAHRQSVMLRLPSAETASCGHFLQLAAPDSSV